MCWHWRHWAILALALAPALPAQVVVNVKAMPQASGCGNAAGDGTANDAAVFMCALKYAASLSPPNPLGVGVATPQVYAPAGIYNWGATTVNWDARVSLVGDGPNSTVFHFKDSARKGGKVALNVAIPPQAGGNPYPVSLKGFALHGPGAYNAGNADTGLAVSGVFVNFEDIHFRGFNLGTTFTRVVEPTAFISFDRPYWQFNTQALLLPSLAGKLVIEQVSFQYAMFINCGVVAGCATFGQASSHGGTDINCHSCSFDNAQLRVDRIIMTCVACHFESVDPYPNVPLLSVGSGRFSWFGGQLVVGMEGASAGIFLSDSNDATNTMVNIFGVTAYKANKAIPFVQLAPGTSVGLTIAGSRIQGSGFPALLSGFQGGTPASNVRPTPVLSVMAQTPSGVVSRQSRGIRAIPYGPTMSLDCALGEAFTIRATSAANVTITAANQFPGELVVLDIWNDTRSALGSVTFGTGFRVGGFTPPGPGAHRSLMLLSDGKNLREVAQTPGDVPD